MIAFPDNRSLPNGGTETGVKPVRPRHCNGRRSRLTTPLGNREGESTARSQETSPFVSSNALAGGWWST